MAIEQFTKITSFEGYTSMIYSACYVGNYDDYKYSAGLLEHDLISYLDNGLLVYAIWGKNIKIIKCLLECSPNVNVLCKYGIGALHVACYNHDIKLITILLKHGANPNLISVSGCTPCMYSRYNIQCLKILIRYGADINNIDRSDESLVYKCCETDNVKCLIFLMEHRAKLNNTNEFNSSPLHVSCYKNHIDCLKILIKHKVNLNLKDKSGYTALMHAVMIDSKEIVGLLLDHKVDVNIQNEEGNTALMLAVHESRKEIAKMLLDYGADVNIQNNTGRTALLIACILSSGIFYDLLEYKSNVNLKDNYGDAVIHILCYSMKYTFLRSLLKYNPDIDSTNKLGYTPLIIGCISGDEIIVNNVLRHSCDMEIKDKQGRNALYITLESRNNDILGLLASFNVNKYSEYKEQNLLEYINGSNPNDTIDFIKCYEPVPDLLKNIVIRSLDSNHTKKLKECFSQKTLSMLTKLTPGNEVRKKHILLYGDPTRPIVHNNTNDYIHDYEYLYRNIRSTAINDLIYHTFLPVIPHTETIMTTVGLYNPVRDLRDHYMDYDSDEMPDLEIVSIDNDIPELYKNAFGLD